MKTKLCRETGKIKYNTPNKAEMHIRKLEIRAENTSTKQGGMAYYICHYCLHYHVGHKSPSNKNYTTIK